MVWAMPSRARCGPPEVPSSEQTSDFAGLIEIPIRTSAFSQPMNSFLCSAVRFGEAVRAGSTWRETVSMVLAKVDGRRSPDVHEYSRSNEGRVSLLKIACSRSCLRVSRRACPRTMETSLIVSAGGLLSFLLIHTSDFAMAERSFVPIRCGCTWHEGEVGTL